MLSSPSGSEEWSDGESVRERDGLLGKSNEKGCLCL